MKLKKIFGLTTFSLMTSVVIIAAPTLTITACGNGGSTSESTKTSEDNLPTQLREGGLPKNYTETQYQNVIDDFTTKFDADTIVPESIMLNLIDKLKKSYSTAYDGFDQIARYFPYDDKTSDPFWTLNPGKTLGDVYDFFSCRVNKELFPTYQNFTDFFALNSAKYSTDKAKIEMLMFWYAYSKSTLNMNKLMITEIATIDHLGKFPFTENSSHHFMTSQLWCPYTEAEQYADYIYSWSFIAKECAKLYNEVNLQNQVSSMIIDNHDFVGKYVDEFFQKCDEWGVRTPSFNHLRLYPRINDQGIVSFYWDVFTRQ